jgi:hypothetical protein
MVARLSAVHDWRSDKRTVERHGARIIFACGVLPLV